MSTLSIYNKVIIDKNMNYIFKEYKNISNITW